MSENDIQILRGAREIARFVYGDSAKRGAVYAAASRGRLPVFRNGAQLCMRKDRFIEWSQEQESAA